MFRTFEYAECAAHVVRSDLISAGFVANKVRVILFLKTKRKWLGVIIVQNSTNMKSKVPIKYVSSSFDHILKSKSIQVNIDKSSACRILIIASSKTSLQNIAIDVFNFGSTY